MSGLAPADIAGEFLGAMRNAGIVPEISFSPVADGRLHRFRIDGENKGKRSGWYALHDGEPPHGHAGDWRTDTRIDWIPTGINGQSFDRSAWEARVAGERMATQRRRPMQQPRRCSSGTDCRRRRPTTPI